MPWKETYDSGCFRPWPVALVRSTGHWLLKRWYLGVRILDLVGNEINSSESRLQTSIAEVEERGCGNSGLGHLVHTTCRNKVLVRWRIELLSLRLIVKEGAELPVCEEEGSETKLQGRVSY